MAPKVDTTRLQGLHALAFNLTFLKKEVAPQANLFCLVGPHGPASNMAERPVNGTLLRLKGVAPQVDTTCFAWLRGPGVLFDFLKEGESPKVESPRHAGPHATTSTLADKPVNGVFESRGRPP